MAFVLKIHIFSVTSLALWVIILTNKSHWNPNPEIPWQSVG